MIPKLMTVEGLREVTFGHRPPRHGLKLLHWFSTKAVEFNDDGQMELQCDPDNGDYGFHHYGNFEDLLPRGKTYFEVGNLNSLYHHGAQDLPAYVREAYGSQKNCYERNKDRIIISLDRASRLIGEVYITEHRFGLSDFSEEGTFLLSPDIIREAGDMQRMDFLTCAGFLFPVNLGVDLWESSFSSDSSLDSDETDDEGQDDSCGSEEWEGPDSNASSGWGVSVRWAPSPEEVCSSPPANPNCMNPPDHLPVQNTFSHELPGAHREVQKQPSFQDSKADPTLVDLLPCKQFIADSNVNQPGSGPTPLNQLPFQQSDLQNHPSHPLLYSDVKPQNKNFFLQPDPDTKPPNQMSYQEPASDPKLQSQPPYQNDGSDPKCENHLFSTLPVPHPEPQNTGYQQDPATGVGIPHGPDHKQEVMDDAVVMNYFINQEDVVPLVVIVMVVLILLVFSFITLGFIIIVSLCVETDCNPKWELERFYLVLSNLALEELEPQDLTVLHIKKKRKKMKKWKRKQF